MLLPPRAATGRDIVRGQTLIPGETGSPTFGGVINVRSGKEVQTCPVDPPFRPHRTSQIIVGTPDAHNCTDNILYKEVEMKTRLIVLTVLVLLAMPALAVPALAGKPGPAPLVVSGCYNSTVTLVRNTCPATVPAVTTGVAQIEQAGSTITLRTSDGLLGSGTYNTANNTFSAVGTSEADPCPAGMSCTYTTSGQFAQRRGIISFSGTGKATVYTLGTIPICSVSIKMQGTRIGDIPELGCFATTP